MRWTADPLLSGFQCAAIALPEAQHVPGDPDELHASLIRGHEPQRRRALLYLHGWSDCFYQAHLADEVESWGMDFHAVDLRRHGRNLVPGQMAGWIADLDEYGQEIEAALTAIGADHDEITLMGHSTGGLTAALWAAGHPGDVDGLILNSPWIDLQGSFLARLAAGPVSRALTQTAPTAVLPLPIHDNFARAVRREFGGEWDIPPEKSAGDRFVVRAGWLAAVLAGHARVEQGLGIGAPILIMLSARSDLTAAWNEGMRRADTVLDVERLASASVRLGRHLTLVRVEGGLHDLVLSAPPVRAEVFAQMRRWVRAYLS
ncbi:alpha/beta hydrolase [Acidipropionibacterium virtanenii]|uniref:2-succinyl-6-hydroxy-2, 4-cyclohexadiene-1-carboxylate synthase n=1 Tax=Acidipropionibacterium virtanenii TaxID=2057246 RepID=A0A344URS5_9ACTN|nr:alpha/beta hydrolase [Acidipropionibacterium virtanenii]AXE37973.1 2-succinyl-6-hydroxy-2,4-cyclohexadiene-1-carboxylate synthase [Acidipropionibacterium virtanenii]